MKTTLILDHQEQPLADLTAALDGRNPNAVHGAWNRLTLARILIHRLTRDSKQLREVAAGLSDLARLSLSETSALAEILARTHDLHRVVKAHLCCLDAAQARTRELYCELARRGQV